ncbi:hypothetical protein [Ktedonobacter robiniae]|uniref:hypothetical protein n=1 Tax=Ktedonobacter robiniae TaxID=2778365 RepID=UPI001916A8BF|nr:hypothetical protein [Ktedonobacter robiniae]
MRLRQDSTHVAHARDAGQAMPPGLTLDEAGKLGNERDRAQARSSMQDPQSLSAQRASQPRQGRHRPRLWLAIHNHFFSQTCV